MRCYRFYSLDIALFSISSIQKPFANSSPSQSGNFPLPFHSHVIHLMVDSYQSLGQAGQTNTAPYFSEVLAGAYKSVESGWNSSIQDTIITLSKKRHPPHP